MTTPLVAIPRYQQPIPALFFGGGDELEGGGNRYNPAVISFIRDEWIHQQMVEREAEYTEYRPMRVFIGTWNVNGKFPRDDISVWLLDGADPSKDPKVSLPDLYVIGLQEMVDLTATNVALGGEAPKRAKQWVSLLEQTLNAVVPPAGPDSVYECVGSRYLVGVLIAVFVKNRWRRAISDVQDAVAPVGVMGVMGNKGGASLRFRFFDSTFCFVCAHLAAHRGAVAQRNADFAAIMTKTEFVDSEGRGEAGGAATRAGVNISNVHGGTLAGGADGGLYGGSASGGSSGGLGTFGILDHDFVVWFGDFNYRIVENISPQRCIELAYGDEAQLEQLRQRDQLNIERAAGRSFHGFMEAPLTFRPTYKFQPGTSQYDQRPDKKLRAPAWCDRILWRTTPGADTRHFRQLFYGSVGSLEASDHKPVLALFETAAKRTLRDRRAAVAGDIMRALDAMENRTLPRVDLSETTFQLPSVVYGLPASATLTITNVGEVAATWRFVPKPEERALCKTWLTVDPAYGMLPPGASASVSLVVLVDDAVARDISLGREALLGLGGEAGVAAAVASGAVPAIPPSSAGSSSGTAPGGMLEDILILRTERGRDFFVTVAACVLPTAFGCSLAQLACRPEPMRALHITAAATAALNAAAGTVPGAVPAATQAALARASGGGGAASAGTAPAATAAMPDLSAGSRALGELLDSTPGDNGPDSTPSPALPLDPSSASQKGFPHMAVSKEIWRLVDLLWRRGGLDARGIFLAPGDAASVLELRECIDTGDGFPPKPDLLAAAQVLLELLSSLREPVIPTALFPAPEVVKAGGAQGACAYILRHLSPLHFNTLVYLVRFAREVLAHEGENNATLDDIAFVLSRSLMRRFPHDEAAAHAAAAAAVALAGAGGGDAAAAGAGGGGGDEEGGGSGSAMGTLSQYADKGTRWEPTNSEQEAMTAVMKYFLTANRMGLAP